MRFYKKRRRRNIKKCRKIHTYEYVVLFENSNKLIDFVCNQKTDNIINSSLYTAYGYYLLYIITNSKIDFSRCKNVVFKDRLHIDDIKLIGYTVCQDHALHKMQKAFKAP